MKRLLLFFFGLALIPLTPALILVLADAFDGSLSLATLDRHAAWFLGGCATWLLLWAIYPRPIQTYVLGHELTHALWGLLSGARVSRLQVSRRGGSVTLSKNNLWITLSPYCFPFYLALAATLFLILRAAGWTTPDYLPFWYAVFGLTWTFHLTFTWITLQVHQPDIQVYGRVFSYLFIACVNLATAALFAHLLTGRPLAALTTSLATRTTASYHTAASLIRAAVDTLSRL
jgi:hypothetical protein